MTYSANNSSTPPAFSNHVFGTAACFSNIDKSRALDCSSSISKRLLRIERDRLIGATQGRCNEGTTVLDQTRICSSTGSSERIERYKIDGRDNCDDDSVKKIKSVNIRKPAFHSHHKRAKQAAIGLRVALKSSGHGRGAGRIDHVLRQRVHTAIRVTNSTIIRLFGFQINKSGHCNESKIKIGIV